MLPFEMVIRTFCSTGALGESIPKSMTVGVSVKEKKSDAAPLRKPDRMMKPFAINIFAAVCPTTSDSLKFVEPLLPEVILKLPPWMRKFCDVISCALTLGMMSVANPSADKEAIARKRNSTRREKYKSFTILLD